MARNFVAPDAVAFSDNAAYDLSADATIFVWFKSDIGDDGNGRHMINADSAQAGRWAIQREGSGGLDRISSQFRNPSDALIPNGSSLTGTSTLDTAIHNICIQYDGSTMEIFQDGVSENSASDTDTIHTIGGTVFFGRHPNNIATSAFDGWLAHGVVWNAVLSQAELTALNNGVNPFPIRHSDQVINCPMDGNNSPENDYSPTQNTGTLEGTSKATENPPVELLENHL